MVNNRDRQPRTSFLLLWSKHSFQSTLAFGLTTTWLKIYGTDGSKNTKSSLPHINIIILSGGLLPPSCYLILIIHHPRKVFGWFGIIG